MPVTIGDKVVLGDDGKFTQDFSPAILGDTYKDSKVFEGVSDLPTLMKVAADSKMAVSKRLENVIQKPAENATSEQKAEYRKALKAALGAPAKLEDIKMPRPAQLPEGMQIDEEFENGMKQLLFETGIPQDEINILATKYNDMMIARYTAHVENQKKVYNEAIGKLDKEWSGDARTVNNKTAMKALMQFSDETDRKAIRDSGLANDLGNHEKWRSLGVEPGQRRFLAQIGAAMKSDAAITDEGGQGGGGKEVTPASVAKQVYNHPTSVKELGGVNK